MRKTLEKEHASLIISMSQHSGITLKVEIATATFAQPRSYFLTVQATLSGNGKDESVDSQKYRTETSGITKKPEFTTSGFRIPLHPQKTSETANEHASVGMVWQQEFS